MAQISRYQRLKNAKKLIQEYFNNLEADVFTFDFLSNILAENKWQWLLANNTSVSDFINFLLESEILKQEIKIKLPREKKTVRYIRHDWSWSVYNIALSIYPNSFLSHYSAMYFHELTDNVPKNIYVNKEQPVKPRGDSSLKQENIDRAFKNSMRRTNQIAEFDNIKVYMLSGKNTGNFGVVTMEKMNLPITNLERTLIDIVTRPDYAGGIYEILEAYKKAKGRCSTNLLLSTLKKLDYIYPYHQIIGFYLEKAGYPEATLKRFDKLEKNYDFYLTYKIKEKDFSERWRLFYPKGF